MPIILRSPIRRLSQAEFGELAYSVMGCVFQIHHQRMHLVRPRVAFTLTALPEVDGEYESHVRRMLRYTGLEAILWANISLKLVTFTTIAGGA